MEAGRKSMLQQWASTASEAEEKKKSTYVFIFYRYHQKVTSVKSVDIFILATY